MKAEELQKLLGAQCLSAGRADPDKDYEYAFASDLMSDVLRMVRKSPDETILITGLCNPQVLRTAEMLDLKMILLVRNKTPQADFTQLLEQAGTAVYKTEKTMFEACGILYQHGLKEIP
jgi:hypothetical protein